MRRAGWIALQLGAGGLMVFLVAALSRVALAGEKGNGAILRLSWQARAERIETCRHATAEELANLPPHMRQEVICDRGLTPYRLTLRLDQREVLSRVFQGKGARQDRPISVYEEVPIPPGTHLFEVRFEQVQADSLAATSSAAPRPGDFPRVLTFQQSIALGARDIALVTYDAERRSFVLMGGAAP